MRITDIFPPAGNGRQFKRRIQGGHGAEAKRVGSRLHPTFPWSSSGLGLGRDAARTMTTSALHLDALALMHTINRRLLEGRVRHLRVQSRDGRRATRSVVDARTLARLSPAD